MRTIVAFEQPIHHIETQIAELRRLQQEGGPDVSQQLSEAEELLKKVRSEIYSNLQAWDKVLMARHPDRPYTLDYLPRLVGDSFVELHGDRLYGDDPAIVGGLATFKGRTVVIMGHQKARELKGRQFRNFGSARPEGYRKAIRLMKLAQKLQVPVLSFIDTPAADCSVDSEARGISGAIASSMYCMATLSVPVIVTIIGEGGSGGAIGIGLGNRVMMLEHSIYSVIPPEGCAAILWKDNALADKAADALRLTAQDGLRLGVVDEIIPEPVGGAHRDPAAIAAAVSSAIDRALTTLSGVSAGELVEQRYQKFGSMGAYKSGR